MKIKVETWDWNEVQRRRAQEALDAQEAQKVQEAASVAAAWTEQGARSRKTAELEKHIQLRTDQGWVLRSLAGDGALHGQGFYNYMMVFSKDD